MGFIIGLYWGFLVGVLLAAGFKYVSVIRLRLRVRKTAVTRMWNRADENDLKKFFGDKYPSHISFLTFEKVNWLNKTLVKLWPFIVEATEQRVKIALAPILETYRPTAISSLILERFHLGKVPPQIDGVRVQGLHKGQVQMDMDFKWSGDGDIVLNIEFPRTRFPIQLQSLSFFARVRVIFQLSDEIPCISALVVALLPDPKFQIKYTLKVLRALDIGPFLGFFIKDMVDNCVADQLEWPYRIVLPVGDTPADIISDLGLKVQGILRVTVMKATGLKDVEGTGNVDPYVKLYVRVCCKQKTRVIHNNLNPEWSGAGRSHNDRDEVFGFNVEDTETQTLVLQVRNGDHDFDKELGTTKVPLHDLKPDTEVEVTKKLAPSLDTIGVQDKGDRGTITVKLYYHPYTKEEQDCAMADEKKAKEDLKNAGVPIDSTMDDVESGWGKPVGAGVGAVGSGVRIVGAGVAQASRMISSGVRRLSSSRRFANSACPTPSSGSSSPDYGIFKSKEV